MRISECGNFVITPDDSQYPVVKNMLSIIQEMQDKSVAIDDFEGDELNCVTIPDVNRPPRLSDSSS